MEMNNCTACNAAFIVIPIPVYQKTQELVRSMQYKKLVFWSLKEVVHVYKACRHVLHFIAR